jgi:signal transduction histidine kinase/CheY-like chemotaxis protein
MKTYHLKFSTINNLNSFIIENKIDASVSILVQIFLGNTDELVALNIAASIKKSIPFAHILGTTTAGEILEGKMFDNSIIISFTLFEKTALLSNTYGSSDDDTEKMMSELIMDNTKAIIIFTDGLKSNGEDILSKISAKRKDLIIAGGRAADNYSFVKTFVFNENKIVDNGMVAVSLNSDELVVYNNYMLNWQTIGQEMTVTSALGHIVFEIDNMKVSDIYKKYLGSDVFENLLELVMEFPLIFEKNGVEIARDFVNYNDDESFSFAGNIETGTKVKFGFGNIDIIHEANYNRQISYVKFAPEVTFIYSCAARKSFMEKDLESEFELLQNIAPTVGYFTYGEYYHADGSNELLNVTTTSLSLSENVDCIYKRTNTKAVFKKNSNLKALRNLLAVTSLELQEAKDKAETASATKTEFLANMSHEIRTPLNAILGFIDILKENEIDDEKLEYLSIVENSGEHLTMVINDILDFSKIDTHKLELELTNVNIYESLKGISDLFYAKVKEKNIEFITIIDDKLPKCVLIDIFRLNQIIMNLLSNAIKFTSNNGEVIYKVEYIQRNNSLNVSIKDNGIGIKEDNMDDIFKAFTQADNSITRQYGGTGLGLPISYELVAMMGGALKVKSQIDEGTEFYFNIALSPCVKLNNTVNHSSENSISLNANHRLDHLKILLVEDNIANQIFMKVVFKKLKLDYTIANDGYEAINYFKSELYDVIIMDENMPKLSGLEATQEIRKIEYNLQLKSTPIIALTANAIKGDKERFLNAGMDYYLTKPLDRKKLISILNKIV